MRVFLDVGAHTGQTVAAVLDPKFGFDRIVCFEPTAAAQAVLRRFTDRRIEIEPFGLWKETAERTIFEPGRKGASIFADKERIDAARTATIRLRRARDWFSENLKAGDVAFMKLNCEGCECDILDDLLDSGELQKAAAVLVFLDVEKIPSQAHRAAEVKARLAASGYRGHRFAQELPRGTHRSRIQFWLREAGALVRRPGLGLDQLRFDLRRLAGALGQAFLDKGLLAILRRTMPRGPYRRLREAWRGLKGVVGAS